jgi:hypothetical protein
MDKQARVALRPLLGALASTSNYTFSHVKWAKASDDDSRSPLMLPSLGSCWI